MYGRQMLGICLLVDIAAGVPSLGILSVGLLLTPAEGFPCRRPCIHVRLIDTVRHSRDASSQLERGPIGGSRRLVPAGTRELLPMIHLLPPENAFGVHAEVAVQLAEPELIVLAACVLLLGHQGVATTVGSVSQTARKPSGLSACFRSSTWCCVASLFFLAR